MLCLSTTKMQTEQSFLQKAKKIFMYCDIEGLEIFELFSLFLFGLWLALPFDSFIDSPVFSRFAGQIYLEEMFGVAIIILAFIRFISFSLNYWRVHLMSSFFTVIFWGSLLFGFFSTVPKLATASVYLSFFLLALYLHIRVTDKKKL